MMGLAILLLAGVSGGLGATPAGVARGAPERIVYDTGPCFGFCPTYRVTVGADGTGVFEGGRFTAVKGRRTFRVTPTQFAAFRDALRADRPAGERRLEGKACQSMATDQITVTVGWSGGTSAPSHLVAYFGCDMDRNATLFRRLAMAPKALPIARFVGDGKTR